jgi:hypothetical protein
MGKTPLEFAHGRGRPNTQLRSFQQLMEQFNADQRLLKAHMDKVEELKALSPMSLSLQSVNDFLTCPLVSAHEFYNATCYVNYCFFIYSIHLL